MDTMIIGRTNCFTVIVLQKCQARRNEVRDSDVQGDDIKDPVMCVQNFGKVAEGLHVLKNYERCETLAAFINNGCYYLRILNVGIPCELLVPIQHDTQSRFARDLEIIEHPQS